MNNEHRSNGLLTNDDGLADTTLVELKEQPKKPSKKRVTRKMRSAGMADIVKQINERNELEI